MLYIANIEEDSFSSNKWLAKIRNYLENDNSHLITICATIESEISELDDEDFEP